MHGEESVMATVFLAAAMPSGCQSPSKPQPHPEPDVIEFTTWEQAEDILRLDPANPRALTFLRSEAQRKFRRNVRQETR